MAGVQEILDALSRRLGRSIAIDDSAFRILFASAQVGSVDDARTAAILNRELPAGLVTWLHSLGLDKIENPVRVPGNAEFRTLPRVCFPLRPNGRLLGYLWMVDQPPVAENEWAAAADTVDEISAQLEWQGTPVSKSLADGSRLATEFLQEGRRSALDDAVELSLLPRSGPIGACCAVIRDMSGARPPRMRVQAVLEDVMKRLHPRTVMGTVLDSDLAFVTRSAAPREALTVELLTHAVARQQLRLSAVGWAQGSASDFGSDLYGRARFATAPAFRAELLAPRAWEELGAWTLLHGQEWSIQTVRELSPAVAELVREPRQMLAETWLAYLDRNRDAQRTCAGLHIHRATLYHRLGRIREHVGDEVFGDGWAGTSAHIALRLWAALEASNGDG